MTAGQKKAVKLRILQTAVAHARAAVERWRSMEATSRRELAAARDGIRAAEETVRKAELLVRNAEREVVP